MLLDVRLNVFLRRQDGLLKLFFWNCLAFYEVKRAFQCLLAHPLSLLSHRRFQCAAFDSLETRNVTVKTNHDDLVTKVCNFGGLGGSQGQGIRATKEDRDIRVSLQHVLPNREAFILHPHVARLLRDNLQIGELRKGLIEAFVPVLFRRCAELTLDNGDLAFSACNLPHVFAKRSSRPHAVRGDEGIARNVRRITINGDNRNLRISRRLDRNSRRAGACRNVDYRIHLSSNEVLHLAYLSGTITLCIDSDNLDSLCFGFTFDRLLDLIEEIGLEIGNG